MVRDALSQAKVRVQRLAEKVPDRPTREQIRRMSDAELHDRMMVYARFFGFDTVEAMTAAMQRNPELAAMLRDTR